LLPVVPPFAPAFDGVEKMFLMRPPRIADVERDLHPANDPAQAAGAVATKP
jgi:hypothetical protein